MLTYGTHAGPARTNSNPPPRAHTHPTSPSAPLLLVARAGTDTHRHYCGTSTAHIAPSVLRHHSHTAEGSAFPRARPYLKRHAASEHAPDRRLAVTRSVRSQPLHAHPLLWRPLTQLLLAAPLLWRMPARRRTVYPNPSRNLLSLPQWEGRLSRRLPLFRSRGIAGGEGSHRHCCGTARARHYCGTTQCVCYSSRRRAVCVCF